MKTSISTNKWMPSLLLALALTTECPAQIESNQTTTAKSYDVVHPITTSTSTLQPSCWTAAIVRLAQSDIDETVMLAFIGSSGRFDLSPGQLLYLSNLGVSSQVIGAMIEHDQKLASRQISSIASSEVNSPMAAKTPPNPSATANLPDHEMAVAPVNTLIPGVDQVVPATTNVALLPVAAQRPVAGGMSEAIMPVVETPKKKLLYPVREPYPVEITAPFVLLQPPSF